MIVLASVAIFFGLCLALFIAYAATCNPVCM